MDTPTGNRYSGVEMTFRCLNENAHEVRNQPLDALDALMAARRLEWLAIAIVAILFLSSCATIKDDEDFMLRTAQANATSSPNLRPMVIWVEDADGICRKLGSLASKDAAIRGCADYTGGIVPGRCLIVVDVNAPAWTRFHEELHCKYGRWHQ